MEGSEGRRTQDSATARLAAGAEAQGKTDTAADEAARERVQRQARAMERGLLRRYRWRVQRG